MKQRETSGAGRLFRISRRQSFSRYRPDLGRDSSIRSALICRQRVTMRSNVVTLQNGTTILRGRYRIDRVVGVGGMGIVYAATQLDLGLPRALKMLHPELSLDPKMRERLVREGRVAAKLELHAGAVKIFDCDFDRDLDRGSPVLIMELLGGASVDALGPCVERPIALRESLQIAYQLLDVLQPAHEKGIVHRDVKPANLFVLPSGTVKVLDFGISRLREVASDQDAKTTSSIFGTPAFMAPEQARGLTDQIDLRADVFAVGATLFTMISGQPLHRGDNPQQLWNRAATEPARSLSSVAPHTPSAVVELVAKAVAFDKSARWPSATAMRDAVLAAHEALFGPPQAATLAALVQESQARGEFSATQSCPESAEDADRPHSEAPAAQGIGVEPTLPSTLNQRASISNQRPSLSAPPSSRAAHVVAALEHDEPTRLSFPALATAPGKETKGGPFAPVLALGLFVLGLALSRANGDGVADTTKSRLVKPSVTVVVASPTPSMVPTTSPATPTSSSSSAPPSTMPQPANTGANIAPKPRPLPNVLSPPIPSLP